MGDNLPFHSYILKIASRCNINCTYCFVYNKGDKGWINQPKFMSLDVLRITCANIFEHCSFHNKKHISLIFHGGEPLLVGLERFKSYYAVIEEELIKKGIEVKFGMQSNGLLFNESLGNFFAEKNISIGISIDGPPHINDIYRVDHQNQGTGIKLEKKLNLLSSDFKSIFSGFLVVVNINSDPVEIYKYLEKFSPKSIDFLLPYDNWDVRPDGKEDFESVDYGLWLKKLFNYWFEIKNPPKIRMFHNMMRLMMGGTSVVESLGLTPVDIIVIETNGDIEAVDSLKASFNGATVLGYNVKNDSFNKVANDINVKMRQKGIESLNDNCKSCNILEVCGGGYIPNRYSKKNGFNNPSIYCNDLKEIINSINFKVREKLKTKVIYT